MKINKSKLLNYLFFIVTIVILFYVSKWFIEDLDFSKVLDSLKNLGKAIEKGNNNFLENLKSIKIEIPK